MAAQTENSRLKVTSPLGDDAFLLHRVQAKEALCRPFRYELDLYSLEKAISADKLLGEPMTAHLALPDGKFRYYNGLVARFERKGGIRSGHAGNYMHYEAVLVPAIWFLQKTADCRIFQEMTAPEIIKEIFRKHAFLKFDESLFGQYRKRNYCVQYRQTDANFVQRLMEEEGIYYRFEHTDSDHTLILCDSPSSHDPFPGYEEIEFYAMAEADDTERECISNWQACHEVQTGTYVHNDYDFEVPTKDLIKQKNVPKTHSIGDMEFYDYPGRYIIPADGDTYARVRIEEQHAKYERLEGEGGARGLQVGSLFKMAKHDQEDQNREYLIVDMEHSLYEELPFEIGFPAGEARLFDCHLNAIVSDVPYRPPCITEKPTVKGPQTAIVVGKSGSEIWTDEHGRVKVQFHWDRYGKNDENSSCWVPVSHPTAGQSWGAVAIPRIGHEVIVDFLEGDPDRPIITGRVYNGDNKPPYGLPGGDMVSGMKSNSTPGGGGYNEYIMDDTKGNELIREHGQFDKDSTIENDLREHVLNNRSRDVAADETVSIGNNQTVTVSNDQTIKVTNNRDKTVTANQSETVNGNKKIQIKGTHTESITGAMTQQVSSTKSEKITQAKELFVGAAYQVTVIGAMNESVGAAKAEEIVGAKTVFVGALSSEKVVGNKTLEARNIDEKASSDFACKAGGKVSAESGTTMSLKASEDFSAQSNAKGLIAAADQLVLECGSAKIIMKSDGKITIQGSDLTLKGSGKINIKADGKLNLKGSQITEN